ncbi:armadillo repeat-containing protein 5 [Pangasianodon hypophthalmus]|uniref:armadillo repeat-containing protein 5 n=1 Tax=Pangasianodon hypophthalmus TaxID=310915 RepID=UPI002307C71B|nr:armadillo repeat-containing protein 5 [Pangasianodon hypophthalmus]
MATQAEQEETPPRSCTEASCPSPESSLSWCLVQLNRTSPRADALTGPDPRPSREADKRLRAGQWRALVAIRTHHIKGGSSRIGRYQAQGGLPPLLAILRRPESSRKILDLTLSILANCCTEKETRAEVRRLDGVSLVVEVLKRHASVETVENRAARALGNLAMDPEGSAQIHSAGGVPPLLLCLSLSSSPSSPSSPSVVPPPPPTASSSMLERAQSAARALFYLSDSPSNRLSLLSQGALPALALFLAPEYPLGLRRACLRALHELTRGCGAECAREVSVSGVLSQLGPLASGDGGGALEELALKTLANLCSQGCLRPLVGSLGVIPKFTEEAKKDPLKSSVLFKALCLCCKEAVNRVKVKESGGLEVLIGFLSAYQNHPLTRLAILACVDFVYDEVALEQLQELGLVPLLVARLVDLARGDDAKMDAGLSASSQCSELSSCFDSFDFPPPEGSRKEEAGKEQGSSSFLSLRSWLLSEGFISSEVELMRSPWGSEGDSGSPYSSYSPSSSSSCSSSPSPLAPADVSSSPAQPKPVSSPSARPKPCRLSVSASPCPLPATCTSTPQPKPPVSPCKVSSPPRKRARTSSLSSSSSSRLSLVSLEAPPAIPKTPVYQHPYHPEPWAPESPILLLLSRFSHATDPSGALITAPVFSALLYYLTQHSEPSGRCCRMLVRISCNLNCLQPLVRTGAVALIRHRLCLREQNRTGEKERQSDRVKAKIRQLGQGLLNNLRVQSETGFGSGVLTHMVLSGSESDKLHCVLSLPLITSNRVLLKKLLLDSGGLISALEPLVCLDGAEDEDDGADKCRTFLSAWICPPEQACASRYHSLYASLLIGCLSSLLAGSKVEPDRRESPGASEDQQQDSPESSSCPCPYLTSSHDLNFLLDDGSLLPASRGVVSGEVGVAEVESEYFRALLRGRFDEAQSSSGDAVHIRDVSRGMLLPVLHYLHGCRMTGNGDGAGRCLVLSSLLSGGLMRHAVFHKTPLAEVMMGANRFLVPGLQRTAEDLCVSVLSSLASEVDLSKPLSAQKRHRAPNTVDEDGEDGTLRSVLPQAYWFSQRYSYSRLGLSCLSILLRPQLPPSVSSDCLLRLVRQADSTESLRRDLLSLAAAALS